MNSTPTRPALASAPCPTRRRDRRWACGVACSALLLTAGLAQAATCTHFHAYADGTVLLEDFVQDGFRFRDRAAGYTPVVEVFSDGIGQPVHGMQFDNRGLRVTLPAPASKVQIKAGPFSAIGLTIRALDATGKLQQTLFIVPDDGYLNTRELKAKSAPITELRIQGGDNNGVLDTVCILR